MRAPLFIASLFCALAVVLAAHADSTSPALSWVRDDGAEGCIALQELATKVEQRLGKPVFVGASSATLHLEGAIAPRAEGGFRVRLTVSDAQGKVLGRRALDGAKADCRALDDALVLVIALAVDSSGGFVALPEGLTEAGDPAATLLGELRSPPAAEAKPAAEPKAPPAAPAKPPTPEDPRDHFHLRLGISALAALGLEPALGGGLGVEPQLVVPGDWAIAARGSGFLANTRTIDGGGELSISVLLAALGACTPEAPPGWIGLRGCAGARIGALQVDAIGLAAAHDQSRLLLDTWLEVEAGWPIGTGVRLRIHVGTSFPLLRDQIQVLDRNGRPLHVFRVSAVTLSAGAGLLVALGS